MATQAQMNEVDKLLNDEYGIGLADVSEDAVERALNDGEEPQAIVDWLAEKYDLGKDQFGGWKTGLN